MTLQQLSHRIRQINKTNGWNVAEDGDWYDQYKIPGILALIHSEVSEALEEFREVKRDNFLEELADVVIRTLDCAGAFTNDFDAIVDAKLAKNEKRGWRHGGKKV